MPDVRARRPEVSAALAAVVERATAKRRENRYADAGELVDDLEEVLAIEAARAGETSGEATQVLRELPADHAEVAPRRLRRPRARTLLLALLGLGALAAAVLVLSGRIETERTGGANPPGPDLERVGLSSGALADYDPEADGGDGNESPDEVVNAIDDIPSTFWSTETYVGCEAYGCDFEAGGSPKAGVGLLIDASDPVAARRLDLEVASDTGWSAEVYAANEVPLDLAGWEGQVGRTESVGEQEAIDLDTEGEPFRYYLLWITSLPPEGEAAISELTLRR
jgi:eukaryotic-like serine/threonine-protein kinase